MTVYGDQGKGVVVWDTATDSKGRNASCNALHTIWDAKFKNKGAHVIHNKDLAILNFALTEVSHSYNVQSYDINSFRGTASAKTQLWLSGQCDWPM